MKNDNTLETFFFVLTLLILGFLILVQNGYIKPSDELEMGDSIIIRDTIWKRDSFKIEKSVPKDIEVLKTDTLYEKNGNEIVAKTEHKKYQDTIACQQDTVLITSYIKGINASQDSLRVILKKANITNTVEITKYIEKPRKKIHIQPQVTTGYDPINKNFGVIFGIGVGIDLW